MPNYNISYYIQYEKSSTGVIYAITRLNRLQNSYMFDKLKGRMRKNNWRLKLVALGPREELGCWYEIRGVL